MAAAKLVALLRGVNVSGRHKVPMTELRALAEGLGWRDVETYIQSGNVVFRAAGKPCDLQRRLHDAIAGHFGFAVPVIVRTGAAFGGYLDDCPFAEAAAAEPNRVLLGLSVDKPRSNVAAELQDRARHGESVALAGDALWIHYAGGVGRSKLTPAVLDRAAGSPVTARNYRTACALRDML